MLISEKIFYLIGKNKLTQKEFSEQTGISQSTISDWKRKKTNPSADKILKICEVLKVTPYELLSETEISEDGKIDCILALDKDEELLLEGFRDLQSRQKDRLLGYLTALREN